MGINHVFVEIGHGVETVAKDIAKGAEEVLTVGGKVLKVISDVKAISPEFKSNLATLVDDAKAIAVPLAPVLASWWRERCCRPGGADAGYGGCDEAGEGLHRVSSEHRGCAEEGECGPDGLKARWRVSQEPVGEEAASGPSAQSGAEEVVLGSVAVHSGQLQFLRFAQDDTMFE